MIKIKWTEMQIEPIQIFREIPCHCGIKSGIKIDAIFMKSDKDN